MSTKDLKIISYRFIHFLMGLKKFRQRKAQPLHTEPFGLPRSSLLSLPSSHPSLPLVKNLSTLLPNWDVRYVLKGPFKHGKHLNAGVKTFYNRFTFGRFPVIDSPDSCSTLRIQLPF